MFLRQSTASQEILLGRFLDSTDGDSEETGLAIANTDIKLWKHGATTLVDKNSGGATHIANGNYYAVLDATDTDTIGNLEVHVHVAGALAVKREYTVLAAAVYDVLFGTAAPSTLDAAAIRTALGMSSADLDTRLDAIVEDTGTTLPGLIAGYLGTEIAAILSRIGGLAGSGVNTILGCFQAMMRSDATIPSDLGGSYDNATDSLQAIRDRGDSAWITGSGGSGSGARSVTITVNDGSTVLEGARVRLSQGAETYVVSTNTSGVAEFSLDDATWTVTITKAGYSFTPTTLVVNGTETQTYSMTLVAIPNPAGPEFSTGYLYCYDTNGDVESGVSIYCKLLSGSGTPGYSFDTTQFVIVSDSNGLATHNGFLRGAKYRFNRGSQGPLSTMVIPDSDSFEIPGIVGSP